MARIVITSAGTLGDFLPFVALGQALCAQGHKVIMAVNRAMQSLCRKAGLEFAPCGVPFGPKEARARAEVFDYWHDVPLERCLQFYRTMKLEQTCRELAAACRGADLLIASTIQGAAPLVREKTGVPWLSVSMVPIEFLCQQQEGSLASTSPADVRAERLLQELVSTLRRSMGLSVQSTDRKRARAKPDRLLLAYSRHFRRSRTTASPPTRQTGFWFYDGDAAGRCNPTAGLRSFVEGGPPPLVFSLSSQPVHSPQRMLSVHVRSAVRLGCRLVVQRGWAGFRSASLPEKIDRDHVFFADFLPHDWLFPRSAALIHHGGIGTTARALRHGLPMLVEPYGNDQFHNACRILELGVGAAMHPHKLTIKGISRILSEKVLQPECRRQAGKVAARLNGEKGIQEACVLIGRMLKGQAWRAADRSARD